MRRQFLHRLAAGAVLPWLARAQQNEISQFDLSLLDARFTSNHLFFIRDHHPAPNISSETWKLAFGGLVEAPLEISYGDLLQLPPKNLAVTIECAENTVGGGLVSTAEWTGAILRDLIEKAKPQSGARFARLWSAGRNYSRTIPLDKARHSDTLVAYRMNGDRLPNPHGFPARAIVPGWYGMASVKWLASVELVADNPDSDYIRPAGEPIAAMNIKSVFARPADGAVLFGRRFLVRGAAWAGESRISRVEISVDSGNAWSTAILLDARQPYCWTRWSYDWRIPEAGDYELLVRAADEAGRVQELRRNHAGAYEANECQKVFVTVH